ncbi:ADP-ribosyltransferase-containing protein, partial [Helicobacter sp. T3_23-1059]
PKIFYHGSTEYFEIFEKSKDKSNLGFWFANDIDYAEDYATSLGKVYKSFLHIKNPLDLSPQSNLKEADFTRIFGKDFVEDIKVSWGNDEFFDNANNYFRILQEYSYNDESKVFIDKIKKAGYDGIYSVRTTARMPIAVVFDSNQIKAIDNKGTFDSSNPNIYHANATLGGGILGGSVAGVEYDENGNIKGFS